MPAGPRSTRKSVEAAAGAKLAETPDRGADPPLHVLPAGEQLVDDFVSEARSDGKPRDK